MCWVEKSIYLWQRERGRLLAFKNKKTQSKDGASPRSQKTSRWLILSAEEAAEHLQHAHIGASLLCKWSGSGLINRMTFKEWLTELRGGEMWGHVKAWKAKKILLHHEYVRTTRQCLRAEVDLSQSEEADLKGYSGVSLIHGVTHCETVLDSLSRDQVSRPLANVVLASSENDRTTTIHCSKWIQI